jgi:GNAT superfamily N-acetyltransferase
LPLLTDRSIIRALLETDRPWALYALGDLAPGLFEECTWYRSNGPALALLYRGFTTPVLLCLGEPRHLEEILAEMDLGEKFYLHIRPEILPLIKARYTVRQEKRMWRMHLPGALARQPGFVEGVVRLGSADRAAVERLFQDGQVTNEAPDFFSEVMLKDGVFFGVREGTELVAAAGTHLVSAEESVAAVGNIYTRRDHRKRGLATCLTGAVASELKQRGIRTVALNVHGHNEAAIRVYERLGFVKYCAFIEGLAERTSSVH